MKVLVFVFTAFALAACSKTEAPVAGGMSQTAICSTAGLLIRQTLGENYKTAREECSVKALSDGRVEIESGYQTPFGATMRYTAVGVVDGSKLRLEKIKVHTVDEDFLPFAKFPSGKK